ncbi:hypothetical protein CTA2_2557 [Colletotrichum tanaceti]|nr:hypothetical protein CTA2_2557 [Colletotrichum tanaceti]
MRLDAQRRDLRTHEAIQSPKWDAALVASHALPWLRQHGQPPPSSSDDATAAAETPRAAVGGLLHHMLLDGAFADDLASVLGAWKAWADNGGMRKSDLEALREARTSFALASLLVAVIRDAGIATQGSLGVDLQECLGMWRQVRLG